MNWVNIKDKLPDLEQIVIVTRESGKPCFAYRHYWLIPGDWEWMEVTSAITWSAIQGNWVAKKRGIKPLSGVTHWHLLPRPSCHTYPPPNTIEQTLYFSGEKNG